MLRTGCVGPGDARMEAVRRVTHLERCHVGTDLVVGRVGRELDVPVVPDGLAESKGNAEGENRRDNDQSSRPTDGHLPISSSNGRSL